MFSRKTLYVTAVVMHLYAGQKPKIELFSL